MRSRGLVVAIAVVLAVAAAAAVILYTQGIKEGVGGGTTVIVANQDIPPNTQLQPLVDQGVFGEVQIPEEALVTGALTTTEGLGAATTTQQIFANEQIPLSRLSTSTEPLNRLGISPEHLAVSVEIDAPPGGLGNIVAGDNVQVFATYQAVSVIPVTLQQYIRQPASATAAPQKQLPPFTLTLIETVKVLKIQNPPVDVETGRSDSSRIQVTFDLEPQDAQNLVYAQENAHIWLGLLPPEEDGTSPKPSTVPLELLLQGARRA
jgi:Flp pilus assembly protein CpaB